MELEPRFGEAGIETYKDYIGALLPFKEASREMLLCLDGRVADYLKATDEAAQELFNLDSMPIQWPEVEIDEVNLFPNAIDILNTRARICGSRGKKSSAAAELAIALRLARKLREAQGPLLVWLCGVACEYRTLRALQCVLSGFSPRDLKADLWTEFPTTDSQRSELSDAWRAEFIYIREKSRSMPLEEAVKDYIKVGWLMRKIDETKESAWPLDDRIMDRVRTMEMAEEICRSEIDWWDNGGPVPHYEHLWQGVPEPPLPGLDHRQFRTVIATIDNPLGKHIARRITKGAWMGRTACSIRRRKLPVTRALYALRSLSPRELRA